MGGKFANGAAYAAFASVVSEAAQGNFTTGKSHQGLKTPGPEYEGGTSVADEAKMSEAAMIDEVKVAEAAATTPKSPLNPAPYSRTGVVEEVVVTGQYTGARATVPPAYVTPTVTPEQFIALQYAAINAQQARVFKTAASMYGGVRVYQGFKTLAPHVQEALIDAGVDILSQVVQNEMPSTTGQSKYDAEASKTRTPYVRMK